MFGEQYAVAVRVGGLLSEVSIETDHPDVVDPELSTVGVPREPVPNVKLKPPVTAVIPAGQVARTESTVLVGMDFVALTATSR